MRDPPCDLSAQGWLGERARVMQKEVAEGGDIALGAIASSRAAERYGLAVLAEDLQDRDDNQTRFVLLARAPDRSFAGGA